MRAASNRTCAFYCRQVVGRKKSIVKGTNMSCDVCDRSASRDTQTRQVNKKKSLEEERIFLLLPRKDFEGLSVK